MRPLKLNDAVREIYLKQFALQAKKYLEGYDLDAKISVEMNMNIAAPHKVEIKYSAGAYLKCQELVKHFPGEVGWYCLVERKDETHFYVYDVLIPPEQRVNGGRVIDATDETAWYDSMTNDQLNHLYLHCHSHVNFDTFPSSTDTEFQRKLVDNMNEEGYYIFQIWNKKGDINTFLYDWDGNLFYGRDDVEIVIEDDTYGTLEAFVAKAKETVKTMEPPKPQALKVKMDNPYKGYQFQPPYDLSKIQEDVERSMVTVPGFHWEGENK